MLFLIITSLLAGALFATGSLYYIYCPAAKGRCGVRKLPACHAVPSEPFVPCSSASLIPTPSTKKSLDDLVKAFQEKHNTKVVFINHGRQKNNVMGVDFNIFNTNDTLCTADARQLLDILREVPNDQQLDIILHTTGGSLAATEVMVKALINHTGHIRIHVPYHAESAGTMLALTANELHIGKGGWLTQVDPQFSYCSASTILEFKIGSGWVSDLVQLGRIGAQKSMDRAVDLMRYIYRNCENDNVVNAALDLFVIGKSNHDKPLTADLLKAVPQVSFDLDPEILELFKEHCDSR